jgi:serine/threonine-protein kinase
MLDDDVELRARGRIGTILCGKYRLDDVLGVGGMAVVYAATHRNQKRVAVKMLHPELSMHREVRARFMREGYAANTVDHPGAVAVLDDDIAEDGAAFLVMERLEGEELERLWQRHGGRLEARVVLAVADPLLAVLEAAHAKSIVHRDIKPANLYITRDGTLKVLDFGIARARDAASEGQSGTKTGMLLGTPAYMAPEQALAKSKEIDGVTDLWSVGATMFALLSGHLVHEGESATAVLVQAATQPARSLALAAPDADPRVVAIVDRALAFDKAARWPNATVMRTAVRDVYLAKFGAKVTSEPLEQLLAEPAATAPTMLAPSIPSFSFTPPRAGPTTPAPLVSPIDANVRTSHPDTGKLSAPGSFQAAALQGATPPPREEPLDPASVERVYVGPEGLRVSSPAMATTGRPVYAAADAAGLPKKSSLRLLALLGGIVVLACAGVGLFFWPRTRVAPSAPLTALSAAEALSAPPPPSVAVDPARAADALVEVGPSDAEASLPPVISAASSAAGSTAARPRPSPPQTALRSALPIATVAPVLVAPAPAPSVVMAPAPVPAPTPVAPPPAPMCRAQCVDVARACKARCKGEHGFGRERHQCLVSCEATERECRLRAPC